MRLVVAMSGPVAVGKTSFRKQLEAKFGAHQVSTREWIIAKTGADNEREALQAAGDHLDRETDGAWVAQAAEAKASGLPEDAILLIDAVRIPRQVEKLREAFGKRVFHVHLHASDETLENRYADRSHDVKEFATYAEARLNQTEAAIGELANTADLVLDADHVSASTLAVTAMACCNDPPPETVRLVDVIVGGQYGSEGKGNICAHLAKEYDVLMRVGGPNAGHCVADPPYKYVQFPSGTGSNPNAKILIGAGSTIWLPQLMKEMLDWQVTPERLSIDPQAMVIDDDDRRVESGSLTSIASTKQGVGVASARKILNRGKRPVFGSAAMLARDVKQLKKFVRDVRSELDEHYARGSRIMLEGTQGTMLSIHHGIWPSVTSRETSVSGCLSDAGIAPNRVKRAIMVVRTYPIRVGGNSGWMGREIELDDVSKRSGISMAEFDRIERGTISGNLRRIAEFDWAQLRRAATLNGATDIALTFADYLGVENRNATTFAQLNDETQAFIKRVERVAGVQVSFVSKEFAVNGVLVKAGWS